MNKDTLNFLEANQSTTPTRWKEEAEWRRTNRSWLRVSQDIAIRMLSKMREEHLTQKVVAERMGCTQQFVSKILRGKENLSLETITKIEQTLSLHIIINPYTTAEETEPVMVAEDPLL